MYTETANESAVTYALDFGAPLLMPKWGYVASAFVLFLIGFFGFFLNLMVILLMFKDRQLWTPLNIILFNLVCSDFSVALLGNPFTLISALFHRWIFGHNMCVLYGFFMALLGITSITTLTVLSFERYMMVSRPLSARHLDSRGALLSLAFIWSYSLALTTPPLLGWGKYVSEAANISCSVNWHEQSVNTLTYILFLFAMGQIMPLAVISFSYINIIKTMKQNSERLGRASRAEAKVTAMVLVMIVSFSLAWTPYSVFALMEQFAAEGVVSPGAGVVPALIAKSSICYDPLIYVGMNTQYRQSIKRFFGIHRKGATSQMEKGYDNTLMSPVPRHSKMNDTPKQPHSEISVNSPKNPVHHKTIRIIDKPAQVITFDNETGRPRRVAVPEKKSLSEADNSGETYVQDDSSGNREQEAQQDKRLGLDSFTGLNVTTDEKSVSAKGALEKVGTGVDESQNFCSEGFLSRRTALKTAVNITENKIRHSHSFDVSGVPKRCERRKLSVGSRVDSGSFSRMDMLRKIFTSSSLNRGDGFETFLCEESHDDPENRL